MMGREAGCAWTGTPLTSSNLSFLAVLLLDVCSRCDPLRLSHVVAQPPSLRFPVATTARPLRLRLANVVAATPDPPPRTASSEPAGCPPTCQRDSPRSADDDPQRRTPASHLFPSHIPTPETNENFDRDPLRLVSFEHDTFPSLDLRDTGACPRGLPRFAPLAST